MTRTYIWRIHRKHQRRQRYQTYSLLGSSTASFLMLRLGCCILLASKVGRMTVNVARSRSPTSEYRVEDREVTFAEPPSRNVVPYGNRGGPSQRGRSRPCIRRPAFPVGGDNTLLCYRCGRVHFGRCMPLKATCYNCGRRGHLRAMCTRDRRSTAPPE